MEQQFPRSNTESINGDAAAVLTIVPMSVREERRHKKIVKNEWNRKCELVSEEIPSRAMIVYLDGLVCRKSTTEVDRLAGDSTIATTP